MDIGKIVNDGLKKHRMPKKELAFKLGVQPPAITKWLSGQNSFPSDKLIQAIKILDLVEEFFPGYKKSSRECDDEVVSLENLVASLDKRVKALENASKE